MLSRFYPASRAHTLPVRTILEGGIPLPSEGTLICSVYTSGARIPIEEALVTVTRDRQLLALRLTDDSGRTAPVRISTPPPADSTAPDMPQGWVSVDVAVDHPGYTRARAEQVQIFPGTRTVQNFALIPLPLDTARQNEGQRFTLSDQNL